MKDSIEIQGIHLRRIGDEAQVLAEVDGEWKLVITELINGNFSHIVEPSGIRGASASV